MSIRTNKMKAVAVLLKRVRTARTTFRQRGRDDSFDDKLDKLTGELEKIKDLFMRVKKNGEELLDTLTEVDGHVRRLEGKRLDEEVDGICQRIRDSANKLLPADAFHSSEDDNKSGSQIQHSSHPSSTQPNCHFLLDQDVNLNLDRLDDQLRNCLSSLSIFPEDAVIKRRHAIYWWIGERFVTETSEEEGEAVIDELLKLNLIVPYGNAKSPLFNKFQIHPHIRPLLQSSVERRNAQHLGSYRWQDSLSHHIEVESQEFLKDLKHLKDLEYLSLRGISRISELPPSIAQLKRLRILDLKACHNLETLPNDISSMKSLTHLVLSHCYLLDAMPKGIDKLTRLQVLKGFVLGSSTKTPCTVSDLANLKQLRRLSIRIGTQAVIQDGEFESLGELSLLKHLKISWGVSRYSDIQIILPPSLKKLHLEGFPGQKIPEWLKPSKLTREFKQLKIMGGKLQSMKHDDDMSEWGMEIVSLKYLKHLKLDLTNLRELFPSLRYAEIKQISNHSYLEWSII